jgi:hypothetical protein
MWNSSVSASVFFRTYLSNISIIPFSWTALQLTVMEVYPRRPGDAEH